MTTRLRRALILWALLLAAGVPLGLFGCQRWVATREMRKIESLQRRLPSLVPALSAELRSRVEAGLATARELAESASLTSFALTTVENRFNAVAADGRINPAEARHLLRLLDDLPRWDDEVHVVKYMGQR